MNELPNKDDFDLRQVCGFTNDLCTIGQRAKITERIQPLIGAAEFTIKIGGEVRNGKYAGGAASNPLAESGAQQSPECGSLVRIIQPFRMNDEATAHQLQGGERHRKCRLCPDTV